MPDANGARPLRVAVTLRSVVLTVGAAGLALVVRAGLARAGRVLGWLLAAAVLAALLHPLVRLLRPKLGRIGALVVTVLLFLGALGLAGYAFVDDVRRESARLEVLAPRAAASIEASERFGELARDLRLTERVEQFVDELPGRLAGGSGATAVRATATRGAAFFTGGVLTVLLLVQAERLFAGLLTLVPGSERRESVRRRAATALTVSERAALWSLAVALGAAAVTWLACELLGVPAPFVLALVVGVLALVPYLGILLGGLPLVPLAYGLVDGTAAVVLLVVFVVLQLVEARLARPWIERRSLRLGPVIPLVAGMFGLELQGLGGGLVLVALSVFAAAYLREVATERDAAAPPEGG